MISSSRTTQPLERAVAKALARRQELRAAKAQLAADQETSSILAITPEIIGQPVAELNTSPDTALDIALDAAPDIGAKTTNSTEAAAAQWRTEKVDIPAEAPAVAVEQQTEIPTNTQLPTETVAQAKSLETTPHKTEGPQDAFTLLLSTSAPGSTQKRQDAPAVRSPKHRIKALLPTLPNKPKTDSDIRSEDHSGGDVEKDKKPSLRSWFSPHQDPNPPPAPTIDPGLDDPSRN